MEAYRVRKNFQWDGWVFAPQGQDGECKCGCGPERDCKGLVGKGCICHDTACHCDCGIREDQYGGDVWFVNDGNERKDVMLAHRFATYDAGLPDTVDEMLKQDEYKRLFLNLKLHQVGQETNI